MPAAPLNVDAGLDDDTVEERKEVVADVDALFRACNAEDNINVLVSVADGFMGTAAAPLDEVADPLTVVPPV